VSSLQHVRDKKEGGARKQQRERRKKGVAMIHRLQKRGRIPCDSPIPEKNDLFVSEKKKARKERPVPVWKNRNDDPSVVE